MIRSASVYKNEGLSRDSRHLARTNNALHAICSAARLSRFRTATGIEQDSFDAMLVRDIALDIHIEFTSDHGEL
jgi:hypothetical protein